MSNPLASLEFSDLPDTYLRPPATSTSSPTFRRHQVPTTSANSASTAALDYQNFNPLTPTTLDAWIVASQSNQTPQPPDLLTPFLPSQLDQSSINPLPLNQPQSSSISLQPRLTASLPHTQTFSQPDRMLYTAPVRSSSVVPPPKPQIPTNLNLTPEPPSLIPSAPTVPSDGLTAVERAKKSADQFTMSQLAKKRKAAGLHPDPKRARNLSSSKSSTEEDDKDTNDLPERISHRKYQKRLQKNRDSAFVSRIRRREYTKLLEESLSNTEKEKDAAVSNFLEMKRRFDIVSAELNAFKQALAPNFTVLKDSLFSQLSTSSSDTKPPRSGSVVTSMFMFTLLFGILLPDCVRHRLGLQRSSADIQVSTHAGISASRGTQQTGIRSMLFGNVFKKTAPHLNDSRGKVWGQLPATVQHETNREAKHHKRRENTLSSIEEASLDLLGVEHSQKFATLTRSNFKELPSNQVARLEELFRQDNTTRFEQLAEIQSVTRQVELLKPSDCGSLLHHVTLQLENARL